MKNKPIIRLEKIKDGRKVDWFYPVGFEDSDTFYNYRGSKVAKLVIDYLIKALQGQSILISSHYEVIRQFIKYHEDHPDDFEYFLIAGESLKDVAFKETFFGEHPELLKVRFNGSTSSERIFVKAEGNNKYTVQREVGNLILGDELTIPVSEGVVWKDGVDIGKIVKERYVTVNMKIANQAMMNVQQSPGEIDLNNLNMPASGQASQIEMPTNPAMMNNHAKKLAMKSLFAVGPIIMFLRMPADFVLKGSLRIVTQQQVEALGQDWNKISESLVKSGFAEIVYPKIILLKDHTQQLENFLKANHSSLISTVGKMSAYNNFPSLWDFHHQEWFWWMRSHFTDVIYPFYAVPGYFALTIIFTQFLKIRMGVRAAAIFSYITLLVALYVKEIVRQNDWTDFYYEMFGMVLMGMFYTYGYLWKNSDKAMMPLQRDRFIEEGDGLKNSFDKGGIDLNNLNMQTSGQASQIQMPSDPAMMSQPIFHLTPKIIGVGTVNLGVFLGLNAEQNHSDNSEHSSHISPDFLAVKEDV